MKVPLEKGKRRGRKRRKIIVMKKKRKKKKKKNNHSNEKDRGKNELFEIEKNHQFVHSMQQRAHAKTKRSLNT
jgi:hypothetical protein